MPHFKFIHVADLHIESPYRGLSQMNDRLGKSLVDNGIRAYENLIQTAIDKEIDFLLIAGDSFDSESRSLSALNRFINGLEKLNKVDIPVYIICGNHDPLSSWSLQLPKNVILYQADEVQQYSFFKEDKHLVEIYGVSFGQKEEYTRWAEQYKRNDTASFSIAMLHGTLGGNSAHVPYSPFDLDDLRASNIDYWALGHIHKREVLSESNPLAVYPGNIQGRHFNETGEKGCSLVEVENGRVLRHDFIPLSKIVYEYLDLDVSEINELSAFTSAVQAVKSEKLASQYSYLLRIRLRGRSDIYNLLANKSEVDDLVEDWNQENDYNQNFVFIDKLINEIQPNIDLEKRKEANDFVAGLLKRFDDLEGNEELMKEYFKEVMTEIESSQEGRMINREKLKDDILEELDSIFSAAKWKCVDGLIKED